VPKSGKAEIEHRVDEVYDLLINRVTYRAIIGYGAQKWRVKERQMNVYIARANERIRALNRLDEEERLAKAIASYESLYARQAAAQRLNEARQTLDSLNRLQGLSGKDKKPGETAFGQKGYVGLDLEDV
jgi:hypothetical protein